MGLDRGDAWRVAPAFDARCHAARYPPAALPAHRRAARQAARDRGREPASHRRLRTRLSCARQVLSRPSLCARGQARHGTRRRRLSEERGRGARGREALRRRGDRAHSLWRRLVGRWRHQRHLEIARRRHPHPRHDAADAHHPDRQGVDDGADRGGHLRAATIRHWAAGSRHAARASSRTVTARRRNGLSRRSSRRQRASGRRKQRPLPLRGRTSTNSSRDRKARSA